VNLCEAIRTLSSSRKHTLVSSVFHCEIDLNSISKARKRQEFNILHVGKQLETYL
jgi:hypothetical protein